MLAAVVLNFNWLDHSVAKKLTWKPRQRNFEEELIKELFFAEYEAWKVSMKKNQNLENEFIIITLYLLFRMEA